MNSQTMSPGDAAPTQPDGYTGRPGSEASPWELGAARGETPPEGSRTDLDLQEFEAAYGDWKDATQQFEQAVRDMHAGTAGGREKAQDLARHLARLHHRFMESSQPFFKASEHKGTPGWEP
jgi:hypothetical protein